MRLLNTRTLRLEEFQEKEVPPYAILSHRWGREEVSFQALQNQNHRLLAGFGKIQRCCKHAAADGWWYVWIDTCCINNASSAELSESINSMYKWYRDAQVCYAYLADVPPHGKPVHDDSSDFRKSNWFLRGWTLQEFLAPPSVVFLDSEWTDIGTKRSLNNLLQEITGIADIDNFSTATVGQKFSWASKRETTRVEDVAYCLLGLFGVNMPLLYGEGMNAFFRLQLAILGQSDDESIFAWKTPLEKLHNLPEDSDDEEYTNELNEKKKEERWKEMEERDEEKFNQPTLIGDDVEFATGGLLAKSPADFSECGDICFYQFDSNRSDWTMTNKGLRVELYLIHIDEWRKVFPDEGAEPGERDIFLAPLNCAHRGSRGPLVIKLKKTKSAGQSYTRYTHELIERLSMGTFSEFATSSLRQKPVTIFVPQFADMRNILQPQSSRQRVGCFSIEVDKSLINREFEIMSKFFWREKDKSPWSEEIMREDESSPFREIERLNSEIRWTYGMSRLLMNQKVADIVEKRSLMASPPKGESGKTTAVDLVVSDPGSVILLFESKTGVEVGLAFGLNQTVPYVDILSYPDPESDRGLVKASSLSDRVSKHIEGGLVLSASVVKSGRAPGIPAEIPYYKIKIEATDGHQQWPNPSDLDAIRWKNPLSAALFVGGSKS